MIKRLGSFFLDILEVVVFAIGIFFFIYLLVMRPHKIDGESMMPNFVNNEYLLTEKVSYYFRDPQRGDVVVFTPPVSNLDEYIKRVIGLPGETVTVKNGHVYINDKVLDEPYLPEGTYTNGGNCNRDSTCLREGEAYKIPDGYYIVMGDNRNNSSDSRYWGPITKKAISGRAWVVYWPINLLGTVPQPAYSFK